MEYIDCKVLFCTYFFKKQFEFEYETYSDYTMFCIQNGKFEYHIDNGCTYQIKSDQAVICPPGKTFHRKMIEPTAFCMIKFSANVPASICETPISIYDIDRYNTNLNALTDCLFCTDIEEHHSVKHFCRDIWYQIIAQSSESIHPLSEALQFIKRNFTSEISINHLAEKNGYSTAGFINLFKKHYGYTPKLYISKMRINYAKQLLLSTEMPICEISSNCGYTDSLYFSRIFKKHTGMSPGNFRKKSADII